MYLVHAHVFKMTSNKRKKYFQSDKQKTRKIIKLKKKLFDRSVQKYEAVKEWKVWSQNIRKANLFYSGLQNIKKKAASNPPPPLQFFIRAPHRDAGAL